MPATVTLGRIQWSKNGITIYDQERGFITRIENGRHIWFLNQIIVEGLRRIAINQTGFEEEIANETEDAAEDADGQDDAAETDAESTDETGEETLRIAPI